MSRIHEIIPEIMREMGAITKGHRAHQYKYRSVEDVLNRLNPLLIAHGVSLSTSTHAHQITHVQREHRTKGIQFLFRAAVAVRVEFHAADGSCLGVEAFGEGIDFDSDKAANKAMSAAFKYAIFLGLCIPTEEGVVADSDRDTPTEGPQDLPAGHPLQQAAQQPASRSVPFDATTPEHQLGEIKQLCQRLKISREVLDAKLAQRFGAGANVTALSPQQADELLGQLRGKALELEGKQAFG